MIDEDGYEEVTLKNPDTLSNYCLKSIDRGINKPSARLKGFVTPSPPAHIKEQHIADWIGTHLAHLRLELWVKHSSAQWEDVRRGIHDETMEEPDDWREYYMHRRAEEAAKIKEVSARMRAANKLAAEEKESKKLIKIDTPFRLPGRVTSSWGTRQPKRNEKESHIFAKARRDAKKISKHFEVIANPRAPLPKVRAPVEHRIAEAIAANRTVPGPSGSFTGRNAAPARVPTARPGFAPPPNTGVASSSGKKRSAPDGDLRGTASGGSGVPSPAKKPKLFKSKAMASLIRKM
ncbi:hypothetical protein HKX48_007489 [Thoreauomyces humboldtii]|nr:hypothetical protein HKX48_007489 [Thoreauomyces humboldtii]